jgi:hypothetical protein
LYFFRGKIKNLLRFKYCGIAGPEWTGWDGHAAREAKGRRGTERAFLQAKGAAEGKGKRGGKEAKAKERAALRRPLPVVRFYR